MLNPEQIDEHPRVQNVEDDLELICFGDFNHIFRGMVGKNIDTAI